MGYLYHNAIKITRWVEEKKADSAAEKRTATATCAGVGALWGEGPLSPAGQRALVADLGRISGPTAGFFQHLKPAFSSRIKTRRVYPSKLKLETNKQCPGMATLPNSTQS